MSITLAECCLKSGDVRDVAATSTIIPTTKDDGHLLLEECIRSCLPSNYNFEIKKTLTRLLGENVQHVALQFPEGLLCFSTQISLILRRFLPKMQVTIMGDVSYGACCIDDFTAKAIGCDFIVHYGHSCLVPVDVSLLRVLYVFVDILFDPQHLCETLKVNFIETDRLALMSTIQYASTVHRLQQLLQKEAFFNNEPLIPQISPLTAGEVLGCTSPILLGKNSGDNKRIGTCGLSDQKSFSPSNVKALPTSPTNPTPHVEKSDQLNARNGSVLAETNCNLDYAIFVADGRFHLESAMIQNPQLPFYRYDPFTKVLLHESYDHAMLHSNRQRAIDIARHAESVCLIMGTLGRQGNTKIVENIQNLILRAGKVCFTLLLCEILPDTLNKITNVGAFVQVACPRLSIDWGHCFNKPLLSPYESHVAFGGLAYQDIYPMDFYSARGGAWTNYFKDNQLSRTATMAEDRRSLLRKRIADKKKHRLAMAVYEQN
ncbi:diphthamide biosynthesis protein 2-related domain-containing protein [Cardiosporidium cionae]|uniref:2-(3-amino-3-carboxypropyl)histidine synthase subunit 1 n=1 Tax=Cardiosporidium cionae TaxID=476202 RepID=A0ABQ7J6F7_9APIC|nr:diphthamide biosynthesis protein 2-related domain-containing protein [Cardiosporidium cionae]|eukprot:KAF8819564.1 diphthamide biosynthesis protein 2-related domain-containing protein [Cardiosporidium cionae]